MREDSGEGLRSHSAVAVLVPGIGVARYKRSKAQWEVPMKTSYRAAMRV